MFLGADAAAGLNGRRGFLYGEKRHRQVDVLGFDADREGRDGKATLDALIEERLAISEIRGWRIVGMAVRPGDLVAREEALLRGLVAGDVVVVVGTGGIEASGAANPDVRILVHRGDRLADVRALSRRS